ncbi:MAG: porin family protein [Aquaticitalea sp.]
MKKLVVMAAVAVFGFSQAQAQEEIQFGVKAGVNFAKLTGDAVEDADGRTGFHIGGVVEIPISEKFSVQPELLYSQQGLQSKESFEGIEYESKLKLDYIHVPVMAKFYVTEGFAIEAGPQFGFNVSAKEEYSVGDDSEEDDLDNVAGFDLSLGAGVSYKLDNGLFFGGRYMFGLSNVNEDEEEGFDDNLTNSVLSLSVGFMF